MSNTGFPNTRWLNCAAALVSALTLSACGGGGDDIDTTASQTRASETAMAVTSVVSTDVVGRLSSRLGLAEQRWQAQCAGVSTRISNIAEPGITGVMTQDGTTLKLGRMNAPLDASSAMAFRVNALDPETSGASRCEAAFHDATSRLPRGKTMWYAFSMWLDDWSTTYKNDQQLITQFWPGDPTANLNPAFAIYVGGSTMTGVVRYDLNTVPSKTTAVEKQIFQRQTNFSRRWVKVVVQTAVSPRSVDRPFMNIWMDGVQVASYTGPIGYNVSTDAVAKLGVYKYHFSTWDPAKPTRQMFVKDAVVVQDANRLYTQADVQALLAN